MDAIRKAGGKKNLKTVSPKKENTEKESKVEGGDNVNPKSGGDLMADLHRKLMMRRKGISGNKAAPGSVMDQISAMIPPPPPVTQFPTLNVTMSSTDEDDWK